jgi:hypothetical protein
MSASLQSAFLPATAVLPLPSVGEGWGEGALMDPGRARDQTA